MNTAAIAGILMGVYVFGLIVPMWKIFARQGVSPWLSLLFPIPFANIFVLWYAALNGDRAGTAAARAARGLR